MGITFLGDAELGADEIRRNAARGFTAVTLPEMPHRIGMEPIFSRLVGSDHRRVRRDRHGDLPARRFDRRRRLPGRAPRWALGATLFGQLSLERVRGVAVVELPVRYPELKIIMSEGGIGWVAMLLDRLENIVDRSGYGDYFPAATSARPRCCTATSGSAPSTTRRRSSTRHRSASTTSCSSPTTRTATAPGPTLKT